MIDPARNNTLRHKNDKFPMDIYMVAGSQAEKRNDNRIYVMKWGDMHRTTHEDEECSDSDEEEARDKEPVIRFEAIPHRGGINRIRSMHGTPIVATWTEDAEVSIYNVASALEELEKPVPSAKA
jgi:ribosome assembly protein RRB1